MWFRIFLWLGFLRLRFRLFLLSIRKPDVFQELIKQSFALQIKTIQQPVVRYFLLQNGTLTSKAKFLNSSINVPRINVSFETPKEAMKITFAIRKEKHLIFSFIQDKKILIEGDFSLIQVIMNLKEQLDQSA